MSEATHHAGPGNTHKISPGPGTPPGIHGPLGPGNTHKISPGQGTPPGIHGPYGHPGTPVPFGQVHHGGQVVPKVVVGPPVPGRPLTVVPTDARINITGPEGLIAAGCVLIVLCITLVSATPHYLPHSLAILAPLIVFGIVLIGLGIFFKTREKPKTPRDEKPKLEGETKGDEEKEKQN